MIYHCDQGSEEWLALRCGRITASRVADVIARLKKGGESQKRADYRLDIIAERLTGVSEPIKFNSPEMRWGSEWEPVARGAYEVATGVMVDRVGFITHASMDYFGCSPDALVEAMGGVELKCPKTTTHLEWLEAGVIPEEHVPQCAANLACSPEREWWDFVSYDPRLNDEAMRLFRVRMHRDDEAIAKIEAEVAAFHEEIEAAIDRLRSIAA